MEKLMENKKLIQEEDVVKYLMPNYQVNFRWKSLIRELEEEKQYTEYVLIPDFQRGHIWNEDQQSSFVEFMLKNGSSPSNHCRFIFWNEFKSDLDKGEKYKIVLVDGLQRITTVTKFLKGEIKAFNHYIKDFGKWVLWRNDFIFCTANYQNELDVLRWYIALNEGGVVHTKEELDRVKEMIKEIKKK